MKKIFLAFAVIVLTFSLAACGNTTGSIPVASAPAVQSPQAPSGPKTASESMVMQYILDPSADKAFAQAQTAIGEIALPVVMMEPYTVVVDGVTYKVALSIPQATDGANKQLVIFTDDPTKPVEALADYKELADLLGTRTSVTAYSLSLQDGILRRTESAVSVVGQGGDGHSMVATIVTERTQPLEMVCSPEVTDQTVYRAIKEAIANSNGLAAESAFLGETYQEYVAYMEQFGMELRADVNAGHTIEYPLVSEAQFIELQKIPGLVKGS